MKKHTLKDIVDDYLKHMSEVNERRLEIIERETECVMEECKLFNLLQQNVQKLEKLA